MTVATGKDATTIRVWQVACIYVGPLGTTAPAGLTDAVPTAMTGLGYIAKAGVAESTGQTISDIDVYEGNIVRSVVSAGSYSWALELEQNTQEVLTQYYASLVGSDASLTFDPLAQLVSQCWLLDLTDEGEDRRIWVPNGQSRRNGDSTFVKTAAAGFPLMVMGYPSADLVYDTETGAQGTCKIWDSALTAPSGS
jgi:hypothetical protein